MPVNNFLSNPPNFTGENYQIWAVKMKSYLDANDLWDVVETDPIPELSEDPTIAEMRAHTDAVKKRSRAMTCIHSAVSNAVFTKIMTCETAKEAWDALKVAFQDNDRTRQMQVLNLRREFELLRMKDTENIKEYSDRLLNVVNKIRLIGEQLPDSRVVEKVLVCLPERFEAKISSLEDSRDQSQMTLPELINALEAQEQRRAIRTEEVIEGAFQTTNKDQIRQGERNDQEKNSKDEKKNGRNPPCPHYSGCTHHMTYDESIVRKLDKSQISKVRIGNGDYIEVKGKGSVAIDYGSGTKIISDVLYVPEINQNLLSVGQLLEKNYSVIFKNKTCVIHDPAGNELFSVKMRGKNFALNLSEIDNSKVQYYEPKNLDDAKIQEIIDETIEGGYIVKIHEKLPKDDGGDKADERPYKNLKDCFMSLIAIFFCIANFFFRFIYCVWEFHFQVAKKSFEYIRKFDIGFEVCLKKHCKTEDQIADIFMKALSKTRFKDLRRKLKICSKSGKEEC
ncbi:uncharacterized protein [Coffea arabica]|uniref:Retrovirus-related Pol polyprotein from transposon TNT 1-94-like beta-barrel domain-containing protein n=1 Tax=Coffea arabica TaxID=13443 RepID=A0ABM4W2S4_COFAR